MIRPIHLAISTALLFVSCQRPPFDRASSDIWPRDRVVPASRDWPTRDQQMDASPRPQHAWSLTIGTIGQNTATAVAIDPSGNVVTTGGVWASAKVGDHVIPGAGGYDMFLASITREGTIRWLRSFGDNDHQFGHALATDSVANLFVMGDMTVSVDLGGGPLSGSSFIASHNSQGAHRWSKGLFGEPAFHHNAGIAAASDGTVYVAGAFLNAIGFGGPVLESAGAGDVFLASYDSSGSLRWAQRFGSTGNDAASAVAVDANGMIYISGSFGATVDFGGGPLTAATGASDAFMASFTPNGSHRWSKRFGATAFTAAKSIAVRGNNVAICGVFTAPVDFGGGPVSKPSPNHADVFVASYTSDGAHRWSTAFGSALWDQADAVAVTDAGDVLVTGYFEESVTLGTASITSVGGRDVFLVGYAPTGKPMWARSFGSPGRDQGRALTVDPNGNLALVGEISGPTSFGAAVLGVSGTTAAFVAMFRIP